MAGNPRAKLAMENREEEGEEEWELWRWWAWERPLNKLTLRVLVNSSKGFPDVRWLLFNLSLS